MSAFVVTGAAQANDETRPKPTLIPTLTLTLTRGASPAGAALVVGAPPWSRDVTERSTNPAASTIHRAASVTPASTPASTASTVAVSAASAAARGLRTCRGVRRTAVRPAAAACNGSRARAEASLLR
jgi:hypothetical protein